MSDESRLQRIFRVNILIGILVAAATVYFILTGHYENLQQRIGAESLLNKIALGGILYAIGFWYLCVFRKQIFARLSK